MEQVQSTESDGRESILKLDERLKYVPLPPERVPRGSYCDLVTIDVVSEPMGAMMSGGNA